VPVAGGGRAGGGRCWARAGSGPRGGRGAASERSGINVQPLALPPPRPDSIRHRLIFALDVETFAEAERLVQLLAKDVGVFRSGSSSSSTRVPRSCA